MQEAARRVRVLIVDDSAVMRSLLRSVVSADPSFEVVGTAVDGESALAAQEDLQPDVILLDVEMPVLDGLSTLRRLRESGHRLPVIMCSSLTQRGARVTLEALAAGAADYVAKPAGQADAAATIRALTLELLPKIHSLTVTLPAPSALVTPLLSHPLSGSGAPPSVVVVGASTGGPAALEVLLAGLPADFSLPVLVAQHMPELFTAPLAERLATRCALNVREAAEGDAVVPGTVLIARGDWHLEVQNTARRTVHLSRELPQNHCRPSVDVLFRSAVACYVEGTVAVVLTGMGVDGLAGAREVREAGGMVLAQDQATSAVWGMPGAVSRAGLAKRVLPLDAIAGQLLRVADRTRATERTSKMREPAVR